MRGNPFILLAAFLAALLAARPAIAEKVPFDITMVSEAGDPLHDLYDAQHLLAHSSAPAIMLDNHSYELRFSDDANRHTGPFGMNYPFPDARHFDENNFALETSAWLAVPTAGAWTFGVTSDDGFSMTVNGETFTHTSRRATRTNLQTIDFPTAGDYPIEVTFFQHLDHDELEVFAASGTHTHMGRRQGFHLINADALEALQVVDPPDPADPPTVGNVVPEPASLSLLGALAVIILLRRRSWSRRR